MGYATKSPQNSIFTKSSSTPSDTVDSGKAKDQHKKNNSQIVKRKKRINKETSSNQYSANKYRDPTNVVKINRKVS